MNELNERQFPIFGSSLAISQNQNQAMICFLDHQKPAKPQFAWIFQFKNKNEDRVGTERLRGSLLFVSGKWISPRHDIGLTSKLAPSQSFKCQSLLKLIKNLKMTLIVTIELTSKLALNLDQEH